MPRPLYSRERPGTHSIGSWAGLRTGLDMCGKSRPPPPGFDPRTVQPVVSRYTNCIIPASTLPANENSKVTTRSGGSHIKVNSLKTHHWRAPQIASAVRLRIYITNSQYFSTQHSPFSVCDGKWVSTVRWQTSFI